MWTAFCTGLGIGTFGAIHCVGMCGPLAFLMPLNGYVLAKRFFCLLLYHLARIAVYVLLGLVVASFGSVMWQSGVFNIFSVVLGVLILIYKLAQAIGSRWFVAKRSFYSIFSKKIGVLLSRKKKTVLTFALLGTLNAFLPCGLVYTALNATFLYKTFAETTLLMFGFGLITAPVLVTLRLFKIHFSKSISSRWSYVQSAIIVIVAVMLIARGLQIDIPVLQPNVEEVFYCH